MEDIEVENDLFKGNKNKIIWNVSLIHEKRLKVLDQHISNLLEKTADIDLNLIEKKINILNKKVESIEKFKSNYNNYKKKVDNMKSILDLQDSSIIDQKIQELENEKLNKEVYLASFKNLKKNIEKIEKDMLKISDNLAILNLDNNENK